MTAPVFPELLYHNYIVVQLRNLKAIKPDMGGKTGSW
jgi:hypothetical protein